MGLSTWTREEKLKAALSRALSQMHDLFSSWDYDGNGFIDKAEFRAAVHALGLLAPNEVCDAVFDEVDADGSGEIEYVEYIKYSLRDSLKRSASRVMDLFKRWDEDASGSVDKQEFAHALHELQFDCPREIVESLFDDIDSDHSGTVEHKELHRALRQGASIKLAPVMYAGAAGEVETSARNRTAPLRTGRRASGSSRGPSPLASRLRRVPDRFARISIEDTSRYRADEFALEDIHTKERCGSCGMWKDKPAEQASSLSFHMNQGAACAFCDANPTRVQARRAQEKRERAHRATVERQREARRAGIPSTDGAFFRRVALA